MNESKPRRSVVIVVVIVGAVCMLLPFLAIAILAMLGRQARNVFVQVNTRPTPITGPGKPGAAK